MSTIAHERPVMQKVLAQFSRIKEPLRIAALVFIGVAAWGAPDLSWLWALIAVPWLIMASSSRKHSYLLALIYYGTASRSIPEIVTRFFETSTPILGLGIWVLFTSTISVTWAIFRPKALASIRGGLTLFATLLIASIPPLGLIHMMSPLYATATYFPGLGLPGIVCTAVAICLLPYLGQMHRQSFKSNPKASAPYLLLFVLLVSSALANALYTAPISPQDWAAINTGYGKPSKPNELRRRIVERRDLINVTKQTMDLGAKVILLPEGSAGEERAAVYFAWRDVIELAKQKGVVILMGMDSDWQKDGNYTNTIKSVGAETKVVSTSRVPMPIGTWHFGLWPGARSNVFGSDSTIVAATRVAVSICYEDMILWTHPTLLMAPYGSDRPAALLSFANQWSTTGTSSGPLQMTHRVALARIAGVPLVSAVNY